MWVLVCVVWSCTATHSASQETLHNLCLQLHSSVTVCLYVRTLVNPSPAPPPGADCGASWLDWLANTRRGACPEPPPSSALGCTTTDGGTCRGLPRSRWPPCQTPLRPVSLPPSVATASRSEGRAHRRRPARPTSHSPPTAP